MRSEPRAATANDRTAARRERDDMPPDLTEKDRADLVAYLDGELDAEASQAIEARLARDPRLRSELDVLRRTWNLLDFLPKPEPSSNFANRTLERLGPADTAPRPLPRKRALPRWAFGTGWAAAVLLAVAGGYSALTLAFRALPVRPEPTDQDLVRDLRVIENKRIYDLVDDMDFLKDLDNPDLFGEEAQGS
jgi:anti-sigma factor RsiW